MNLNIIKMSLLIVNNSIPTYKQNVSSPNEL